MLNDLALSTERDSIPCNCLQVGIYTPGQLSMIMDHDIPS